MARSPVRWFLQETTVLNRRELVSVLAATGIGSSVFHRAVSALASQKDGLSKEALLTAAWITDFELSDDDADSILENVKRTQGGMKRLRKIELDPFLAPAFQFEPLVDRSRPVKPNRKFGVDDSRVLKLPESERDIAFSSVHELAHFLKTKQITSRKLTEIYLRRLKRFGPMLRCVVNLTEELALKLADQADQEIGDGNYRGPLHGIPWGAKDLIDVKGYPTTWGIPVHQERMPEADATIYQRLTEAGAVLVAKLSLGAIAMGDKWFGGLTRNPWNPRTGSSGSSAGSAAATSAGLVGFTLGSETLGSITSPSKICGSTGFRPTFGRVSRHGCMPLSWTMDKIGPICRSALDCAMVFSAIHGADGKDRTAKDVAFGWNPTNDFTGLKVGIRKGRKTDENRKFELLEEMGCELVEVRLPTTFPIYNLAQVIDIEAASVFDELLRAGQTEGWNTWPGSFKSAQFVSAIDFLRLMRLRSRLMKEMEEFMSGIDLLFNQNDVFHTNLTGHPSVVLPYSYEKLEGGGHKPVTVTITGQLDDDARLLAFANAYQTKVANQDRPELESWLKKFTDGVLDKKPEPANADD